MSQITASQSKEVRLWATFAHLSGFAGFIVPLVGNILGPLIIWLIKKEDSQVIGEHAKEALNFQISITIYTLVSYVLVLVLIGVPIVIALVIFDIVFVIKASIAANKGEYYKYPLTIRLIK